MSTNRNTLNDVLATLAAVLVSVLLLGGCVVYFLALGGVI